MSSIEDILYAPIEQQISGSLSAYTAILDDVLHALDGSQNYEFSIDPSIPIVIYETIAEMVQQNPTQIAYLKKMVSYDPSHIYRPPNAMNVSDVFRRIHQGQTEFWYAARANGVGVNCFEFENQFAINGQIPLLSLIHSQPPATNYFEWWVLSLMDDFVGYNQYYAFGTEDEAQSYYGIPSP